MARKKLTGRTMVAGKDYELRLPKGHLSPSQIEAYLKCGEAYYRSTVLGKRGPLTSALYEGLVMADVQEETGKVFIKTGRHLSRRDATDLHQERADKREAMVDRWDRSDSPNTVITRGRKFIKLFWGDGGPETKPVAVEKKFTIELAGVPVIGRIDMMEAKSVVDFKVAGSSEYYDVDRSLQLAIYAVAMQKKRVAFCVFEKYKQRVTWLEPEKDLVLGRRKLWLERIVSQVAYGISCGVFVPCKQEGNRLCCANWCHHWDTCAGTQ